MVRFTSETSADEGDIVPIVYAKALIYRPPSLTNVYFNQAYQLNNYAVEGVTGSS